MVQYRAVAPSDFEALQKFVAENGWSARVSDPERFQLLLAGSDRTVVALDGTRIVGFARALCDGVSNGYISMVVVAEGCRRQGIGRCLIEQIMKGDPEGNITWMLRAGRDSAGFWQRLGFKPSEIAMERVRQG